MRKSFSNIPRKHTVEESSRRQHAPLRRATTARDRGGDSHDFLDEPGSATKRPRKARSAQSAHRLSGYKSSDMQIIASSDSDDVECVSHFSNSRVRGKQHEHNTHSRLPPVAPEAVPKAVAETGAEAPKSAVRSTDQYTHTRRVKPEALSVILDTDEDELIKANTTQMKRAANTSDESLIVVSRNVSSAQPVQETPKKRTRMRPAKAASIQSSPMLLHASSPTIRRFNSNDSSTLVLAIASQDEDDEPRAVTPLLFSNPSSETMVGTAPRKDASSANIGAILASSPPIGSFDFIPETPRLSPVSPTAPKSRNLKAVSGDLSSDPISEFCTPLNSPSVNRSGRRPGNALPSAEHTCLLSSDPGYAANTDESANINSIPGEKYTQTSVTQWYHENLVTGNLAADSQVATGSIAATTITVVGTGESQSSDIAAHVGDSNEHVHHRDEPNDGCDDGYSSPLEGFWDLRKAAPNSLQDRDMYINQFGAKSPIRPSSHSDIAPALARPGPPIPMRPPLQAPARPRARGAAPVPRGGLRVPVTMSRAQSQTRKPRRSAIRPVLSSRTSLQHPTPRQPAAPVGYNHYADDPPSEFSGFLGFEGPGVSRFG